jgi:hypothetical protein
MICLLLLKLTFSVPVVDHVHTIEHNVIWTTHLKLSTQQWIFWENDRVVDWRWYHKEVPYHHQGKWHLILTDSDNILRVITADTYVVVNSTWDREVADRHYLPPEERRKLSRR